MTKALAYRERLDLDGGWAEAKPYGPDGGRVRIGDRIVPRVISVHFMGADGQPALDMRLEVIDGVPQCRELRITSSEGGRGLKPLDLRAVRLVEWIEDIYAMFAMRVLDEREGVVTAVMEVSDRAHDDAISEFKRARRGKGARKITPAFLASVAEIYKEHQSGAPTAAVASAFGVRHRMASEYAKRAEAAGYLPATSPGKRRS